MANAVGSWVTRFLKGELGWKAVTGGLLIFLSVIFTAMGHADWAEYALRLGEGIGIIGLRDAFSKLPK